MNVTLWLALLLQIAAMALLRVRLGRLWLRRPATLLVIVSVVYNGLTQVLLAFPSIQVLDMFRSGVQQGYIDEAALIMSAGMLVFAIVYLMIGPKRRVAPDAEGLAVVASKVLDWRLLALACAPLAILTYSGRGYDSTLTTGAGAPVTTSLAADFFVILVVLTAFSFVLRHGPRSFLPALIAQSALLAAAGERTPLITDVIVLILLLNHAGVRPPAAQLRIAAALTVAAILAITGLRAEHGRTVFLSNSGLSTRVTALGGGLATLPGGTAPGDSPLAAQAAERLDGVSFAGAVLQAESKGQPRLAATDVPESLLLAVPSAVWPSKLAHSAGLNPFQTEINDFGLQKVNYLPTLPGLYAGFLPVPGLIAFLAVIGAACGLGERWLFRRRTPARLVLLAGAISAALRFEQGLPGMLVALRSAAVIAIIAWLAERARHEAVPAVLPHQARLGTTEAVAFVRSDLDGPRYQPLG
jgi:hypothetical protein